MLRAYANAEARPEIAVGDLVLAHQRKKNRLSTPFDSRLLRVICKRGTIITACCSGKNVISNVSHFKFVSPMFPETVTDKQVDVDAQDDDIPEQNQMVQFAIRVHPISTNGLRHIHIVTEHPSYI